MVRKKQEDTQRAPILQVVIPCQWNLMLMDYSIPCLSYKKNKSYAICPPAIFQWRMETT